MRRRPLTRQLEKAMEDEESWEKGGMETTIDEVRCPITLEVMVDPVVLLTPSMRSFERRALERWLEDHPTRDPLTNHDHEEPLRYVPNRGLVDQCRNQI